MSDRIDITMNIIVNSIEASDNKTVLLLPPEYLDNDTATEIQRFLKEEMPNVEWKILTGGFTAVVSSEDHLVIEVDE